MKTSTQSFLYVNETPKVQSNCLDIDNMKRKFARLWSTDPEAQPVEYNNKKAFVNINTLLGASLVRWGGKHWYDKVWQVVSKRTIMANLKRKLLFNPHICRVWWKKQFLDVYMSTEVNFCSLHKKKFAFWFNEIFCMFYLFHYGCTCTTSEMDNKFHFNKNLLYEI